MSEGVSSLCCRTVALSTTVAAPARRRMLNHTQANYTQTFTTAEDNAGNFATFSPRCEVGSVC